MGWRHEPQTREHRIASYNKGCRCDQCKDASRLARRFSVRTIVTAEIFFVNTILGIVSITFDYDEHDPPLKRGGLTSIRILGRDID